MTSMEDMVRTLSECALLLGPAGRSITIEDSSPFRPVNARIQESSERGLMIVVTCERTGSKVGETQPRVSSLFRAMVTVIGAGSTIPAGWKYLNSHGTVHFYWRHIRGEVAECPTA